MKLYEIMDMKAHSGPGTPAIPNDGELGLSDSQCHVHFISLCPKFLSRPKSFLLPFLKFLYVGFFFPVTPLETASITKQITV